MNWAHFLNTDYFWSGDTIISMRLFRVCEFVNDCGTLVTTFDMSIETEIKDSNYRKTGSSMHKMLCNQGGDMYVCTFVYSCGATSRVLDSLDPLLLLCIFSRLPFTSKNRICPAF